jgi:hypothetical protein
MECIDRLGVAIVPRESWDDIRREQDWVRKNEKRALAFLTAFPGYRGILNIIRGAIGGSDPVLAQKAIESFRLLSRPFLKDLRRAIANGAVQQLRYDEAFVAYLHLVIGEGIGYWRMIDPRYSAEEGAEILMDIVQRAFVDTSPSNHPAGEQPGPSGEVEDGTGTKTWLRDISINGECVLRGRAGDVEVEVLLDKLAMARFRDQGGRHLAKLTAEDGQKLEIEVDGAVHVCGMIPFGSIRIPLKRIVAVCFGEAEPPATMQ